MTPFPKAWSQNSRVPATRPSLPMDVGKRQNEAGRWRLGRSPCRQADCDWWDHIGSQIAEMVNDLPVLLVARKCENGDLHSLAVDNELGAYRTKHLIEQGHDRIAMIGGLADHEDAIGDLSLSQCDE